MEGETEPGAGVDSGRVRTQKPRVHRDPLSPPASPIARRHRIDPARTQLGNHPDRDVCPPVLLPVCLPACVSYVPASLIPVCLCACLFPLNEQLLICAAGTD
jgi:hypothetical protein